MTNIILQLKLMTSEFRLKLSGSLRLRTIKKNCTTHNGNKKCKVTNVSKSIGKV